MVNIEGCFTALVTPFQDDFSLDFNSYRRLIEIQVETKELPKSRRWLNKQRSMTFVDFFVCPERRRAYYATMPVSIEDLP